MEDKQKTKEFNVEAFLSNYKNLSLPETFNFFETNYKQQLLEQLETGTINLDKVESICKQTFQNNHKLAEIISDFISKKIAQNKDISLEGKNAENIKLIVKIEDYREKVKKGNLSQNELKDLCDITFGKDSEESKKIYTNMQHLIKTDEQLKYEKEQENIKKEMFQETKAENKEQKNHITL